MKVGQRDGFWLPTGLAACLKGLRVLATRRSGTMPRHIQALIVSTSSLSLDKSDRSSSTVNAERKAVRQREVERLRILNFT